ncbi:MAG TPA: ferrous iron transport protein A [Bifidobacterium animalis]|nr:ferrous iron transport protein A [Bifidobacterium animalis]
MSSTSPSHSLTLETCPLNTDVVIRDIALDERHRFRMLELGLRDGVTVRAVQKSNFGGRVVAKGTERIALDESTARSIHVTTTTAQTAH